MISCVYVYCCKLSSQTEASEFPDWQFDDSVICFVTYWSLTLEVEQKQDSVASTNFSRFGIYGIHPTIPKFFLNNLYMIQLACSHFTLDRVLVSVLFAEGLKACHCESLCPSDVGGCSGVHFPRGQRQIQQGRAWWPPSKAMDGRLGEGWRCHSTYSIWLVGWLVINGGFRDTESSKIILDAAVRWFLSWDQFRKIHGTLLKVEHLYCRVCGYLAHAANNTDRSTWRSCRRTLLRVMM